MAVSCSKTIHYLIVIKLDCSILQIKAASLVASKICLNIFSGIMVGYTEAAVSVLESDGVAQLTVAISVPDTSITFGSFSLSVNTSNGMTTGWWSTLTTEIVHSVAVEHMYGAVLCTWCVPLYNLCTKLGRMLLYGDL